MKTIFVLESDMNEEWIVEYSKFKARDMQLANLIQNTMNDAIRLKTHINSRRKLFSESADVIRSTAVVRDKYSESNSTIATHKQYMPRQRPTGPSYLLNPIEAVLFKPLVINGHFGFLCDVKRFPGIGPLTRENHIQFISLRRGFPSLVIREFLGKKGMK